jgi:hypothetical protein
MIVARDDAVYVYGAEGRGACYAYEGGLQTIGAEYYTLMIPGPKSSISVYRHNLIITSPPFYPTAGSASATIRNYVSKAGAASGDTDIAKVTILDLNNKLVSYSATFKKGVRSVFSQWSLTFVLEGSGKVSIISFGQY